MKKMTEGRILPQLLLFSLPLILGTLLQLTYNLFDFVVLGWFSNDPISAQASLSVASPIYTVFLSLISGLCVGLAIHSGQLFGAGDSAGLKKQFASCLLFFGFFSLLLTLLFNALIQPIMLLASVSDATLKHDAMVYLGITSLGFVFLFLYNLYASFLRAIGDSIASLLFLALSCLLNIGLNILFVVVIKLDIVGVALSTLISQSLAAISILVYGKIRYRGLLVLSIREYRVDRVLLKTSASYAIASALQQIVLSVGKFIVSIQINSFDAYCIAAFGGANKVDNFVFSPCQNFGHATSIFMAQNRGANKKDRFKKGFLVGLGLNLVYGLLISLVIFFAKRPILELFISPETANRSLVIDHGVAYLSIMCFLYLLPALTNSVQAFFRGLGKLNMVFYSTSVQIVIRVFATILLVRFAGIPMEGAAFATMIGWIAMLAFEVPFLFHRYNHLDTVFPEKERM